MICLHSLYLVGFFVLLDLVVPPVSSSAVCRSSEAGSNPRSRSSSCSADAELDAEVKATLIALCTVSSDSFTFVCSPDFALALCYAQKKTSD